METADFMQKLSQHAQQTGELMEEAVRQMEMLQAETEHYKKYEPIKGWYISVKEHNRIVSRLQADCADRNRWKQIAEAQNKRIDELEAELEQARAERDAAIKDIPHKCWSCRNGFYTENGFDCNETHYKSGHKDCLSWQWRGAKEG